MYYNNTLNKFLDYKNYKGVYTCKKCIIRNLLINIKKPYTICEHELIKFYYYLLLNNTYIQCNTCNSYNSNNINVLINNNISVLIKIFTYLLDTIKNTPIRSDKIIQVKLLFRLFATTDSKIFMNNKETVKFTVIFKHKLIEFYFQENMREAYVLYRQLFKKRMPYICSSKLKLIG